MKSTSQKSQNRRRRPKTSTRQGATFNTTSTIGGFPDRTRVKLRYTDLVELQSASVSGADYVYRGSSVFDPDFTGTGSQPANFDDFAFIYDRYRVHGSTISISVTNYATGSVDAVTLLISARFTSTAITSLTTLLGAQAQPYSRLIKPQSVNSLQRPYTMSMSTRKRMGMTPTQYAGNQDLTATVNTNPAQNWYWHLSVLSDDLTSTNQVSINVTLTYDVEFYQRIDTSLDLDARLERFKSIRNAFRLRNIADKLDSKRPPSTSGIPSVSTSTLTTAQMMGQPDHSAQSEEWGIVGRDTPGHSLKHMRHLPPAMV